jgi:HMG (high mobility group) box
LVSVAIAKRWRDEPPSIRSRYDKLAELERILHIKKYPDYKFRPRKKTSSTTTTHRLRPSAKNKPRIKPSPQSPQSSLPLAVPQISFPEAEYQYQLPQWGQFLEQGQHFYESSLPQESLFVDIWPYQEDDIKVQHHHVFLS